MYSKQHENKSCVPIPIHPDLFLAMQLVYEPNGLNYKNLLKERESEEYGAFVFEINQMRIKFRVGKTTPKKIGQFVTLWKRIENGVIIPHDVDEPIDLFIISVRYADRLGQFVFPKTVLFEQGILSKEGKGGKRALRIYPTWDITVSKQAKQTQAWQCLYFFEIPANKPVDSRKIRELFS